MIDKSNYIADLGSAYTEEDKGLTLMQKRDK
jgi:hypothetical protein